MMVVMMIQKSVLRIIISMVLKVETIVNNGHYIIDEYFVVTINILHNNMMYVIDDAYS